MNEPRQPIYQLLPYQEQWATDDAPIAVAEKARRVGWTFASAWRAVKRRVARATDLFYIATDESAARAFVSQCATWARLVNARLAPDYPPIVEDDGFLVNVLRFANGSAIYGAPSRPAFLRSKGGDVYIDEFAWHPQPRELIAAAFPVAQVWGHEIRVWSTHNGQSNAFVELLRRADEAKWPRYRCTIYDAVAAGLHRKIDPSLPPDPQGAELSLDRLQRDQYDQSIWRQEYLCEPDADSTALLSYALIASCESPFYRHLTPQPFGGGTVRDIVYDPTVT